MKPRGFEFEEVLTVDPGKSWFDMSYKNRFTCNFGKLYPFYLEETMPGDTFKIKSTCFARLQPLLSPVMAHCDVFSYFFYVPNRLLWSNWKKFQSNGDGTVKMADAASYVPPAHPYIHLWDWYDSHTKLDWMSVKLGNYYYLVVGNAPSSGSNTMYNPDDWFSFIRLFDHCGISDNSRIIDHQTYGKIVLLAELTISGSTGNYTATVKERYSLFAPPVGSTLSSDSSSMDGLYPLSFATEGTVNPSLDDINAFPFYAYNKIYNEFFRSQDYQDELNDECTDGVNYFGDTNGSYGLLSKAFEHDYFTSILPDCQRGPDVSLSLAGTARLVNDSGNYSAHPTQIRGSGATGAAFLAKSSSNNNVETTNGQGVSSGTVQLDITGHTKVDLSGVSAVTINALRYANTLQRYEEALARSGSRYNEMLISLFGVISSDASIQRPIFLGASRTPIQINDVAQTSETPGQLTPLATLAGRGIAVGEVNTDFYCEENGWIIGLCAVVPRTQYYQGLNRHLRKSVNLDYPVPMFAHLGEQEVYKEELFSGANSSDRTILGYLPRFSEFKYHSDELHGLFRTSLNFWTMVRNIEPGSRSLGAVIDSDFLRADTMNYDAFAYTKDDSDHFILDFSNTVHLLRALPEYSTPQL